MEYNFTELRRINKWVNNGAGQVTTYCHLALYRLTLWSRHSFPLRHRFFVVTYYRPEGKKRYVSAFSNVLRRRNIFVPFLKVLEIASTMIGSYFLPNSISHRFRYSLYTCITILLPQMENKSQQNNLQQRHRLQWAFGRLSHPFYLIVTTDERK